MNYLLCLACKYGNMVGVLLAFDVLMIGLFNAKLMHGLNGQSDAIEGDRSCISNVLKAIKNKVTNFTTIRFQFVPRLANNAAHALAKAGRNQAQLKYWMEEIPASVEDFVERDRKGNETIGLGREG
ncbi:hypothetical protein Gogos_021079 [Gossypium gossypioides]|uniref:RNase H type-1 domain-containing protein n=1 Tax=Gossypium gossypioides TaxID=34282 RepID=A0A7J9D436_GOSGO|nr:hypothetical protein [Gossypium gossypioides]